MRLLSDCRRVLKPDGIFSTCVPNASNYVRGYLTPDNFDAQYLAYKPAVNSDQEMDILNYIAYMDGDHKYMFDKDNLVHVLLSAGFSSVRLREFDPCIDSVERKFGSIYAMGVKS